MGLSPEVLRPRRNPLFGDEDILATWNSSQERHLWGNVLCTFCIFYAVCTMYKCNLYDECSSNQSRSTHPSNESQAEQTHNRKVSWVMKPSFLLSIWRGATLFIRPYWNVLGESGGEKTLFYSHLPLHMKPKDYRQLLKLEAPAWGEGRGQRKVERLGLFPHVGLSIMEDSYSNYSICFNLSCDTWLIDISAWKQMYFPKKYRFSIAAVGAVSFFVWHHVRGLFVTSVHSTKHTSS